MTETKTIKKKEVEEKPVEKKKNPVKFTKDEESLIRKAIRKFKSLNSVSSFSRDLESVQMVIEEAHDSLGLIGDVPAHKLMYSILKKCGVEFETPETKKIREAKELKETRANAKAKLKERVEQRHKEELEKDLKKMGLIEKEPEEEKPPRKDVTTLEMISNIPETLAEKSGKKKGEEKTDDGMPDLNYDDLSKNTVAELKELADFLNLEYTPNVLKDNLISQIKSVL